MKAIPRFAILSFLAIGFFLHHAAVGQIDSCGFNESQQLALTQEGGYQITSLGTVKALLIFIDFTDDTEDPNNPTWPTSPAPGIGPNYLNDIVDVTETQNSGLKYNLTTFFRKMSYDQFTMIGQAYYKQVQQNLSWYVTNHPGEEAAWAARDAIALVDASVDFSDFDRWTYNGSFNHTLGPDGKLDMVFVCFRRWYLCPGQLFGCSFIAQGWYGASLPNGSVNVDKGRRQIVSSQAVDVLEMRQYPRLDIMVHEFGHVWGLPHNYSGGLWSLMSSRHPAVSYFMNSYEREQLGWLDFNNITVDGTTTSIADFSTTAVAYRIAIPTTSPQEYFLFENHQQMSLYDTVDISTSTGPGLYILHDNGVRHVEANNLRVVSADGRWTWSNPYWIQNLFNPTNPLDSIPVFSRGTVNRAVGETDKVDHMTTKGYLYLTFAWLDDVDGTLKTGQRYKGDGKDRFTFEYNKMFSPWSGYAAYNWSGSAATTIGMEITGPSQPNINVKFYTTSPVNGPPSKPVDPRLSSNSGQYGNIRFSWAANAEPDLSIYEVWRKVDLSGNVWGVVATTTSSYWVDPEYLYAPGGGDFRPTYKVRAKDTQGLFSSFSDSTTVRAEQQGKRVAKNEMVLDFALEQNYPNPFNPATTINFDIPSDEFVSLKVFDVLGREVQTLVGEVMEAGSYKIPFDASKLASGVYLYKLQVGPFTATRKMLLTK